MASFDDTELVLRTQAGEVDAFAELTRRYRSAVFGAAYHRVGDPSAAEDLAQDALVHAYTHLSELREPSRFGPWLFAIARSLCAQWARRRGPAIESDPPEPVGTSPEQGALDRDVVRRALRALPREVGLAVTLFHVAGYSYQEVARFVGVSTTTVKGRIERGRRQLRREIVAMMEEQLGTMGPSEEFVEKVLTKVASEDLRERRREAPKEARVALRIRLDGDLAQPRNAGRGGSSEVEAISALEAVEGSALHLFRSVAAPERYHLFGKGRLAGGAEFENACLEAAVEARIVEGAAKCSEPPSPIGFTTADLRALPIAERGRRLEEASASGSLVFLDEQLASIIASGARVGQEGRTPGGEARLRYISQGASILRVADRGLRYVVFGEVEVGDEGLRVRDGAFRLVPEALGPVTEVGAHLFADTPPLPEYVSHELHGLPEAERVERLRGAKYALIDGELCEAVVPSNGRWSVEASSFITCYADEEWVLYTFPRRANRYYVHGQAEVHSASLEVVDAYFEASVSLSVSPPDAAPQPVARIEVSDLAGLAGPERDSCLASVPRFVRPLILGCPARGAFLASDAAGGTCSGFGGNLGFTVLSGGPILIFRWFWPEPHYLILGDARVDPGGVVVRDGVVRLRAEACA